MTAQIQLSMQSVKQPIFLFQSFKQKLYRLGE